MSQDTIPRVFISYTTRDSLGERYADELLNVLRQNNYSDVFYWDHSRPRMLGAPLWGETGIPMEIKNRDILVVLCTTNAILASPGVEREWGIALRNQKLVVPLKYDNAPVPSGLIEIYETFTAQNYVAIFNRVAENLPVNYRRHCDRQERNRIILASIEVSDDEQRDPQPREVETGSN